MLAVTAFLLTLLVIAVVALIIGYFLMRPAWTRVARACDQVDQLHATQESDRKKAEAEIDEIISQDLHTNT